MLAALPRADMRSLSRVLDRIKASLRNAAHHFDESDTVSDSEESEWFR